MGSNYSNLRSAPVFFLLFTAYCLLLTLPACGDPFSRGDVPDAVSGGGSGGTGDSGGGGGTDGGTTEVSFAKQVYPALQAGCSCHAGAGQGAFGLGANSAEAYDKVKALVNPASPADSKLVKKGKGIDSHIGGAALSEANATIVINWITQGAANN